MKATSFLLLFVFIQLTYSCFAQSADSTKNIGHFLGAVSVTNNGISFIPSFSLGKPAAIFDLSLGKRRLYFEPQLRFALEGKPWSFLFWWRYKLVQKDKWRITLGAHPALNFRNVTDTVNGYPKDRIVAKRYAAGEFSPNYLLSKNISVGIYYLYSRGIDNETTKNTHFVTVNSSFSNIRLVKQFLLKVSPQLYYLNQDTHDGFYATSTVTLAKSNFPLSLSALVNKSIRSDIPGSKDFVWNATLVYAFGKQYVER